MANGIKIRELNRGDLEQAGQILGRGMSSNPVNIHAFAIPDAEQRIRVLTRFFGPVLIGLYRRGIVYGAFRDEGMVGVCGIARPGFCQPTLLEKLSVIRSVMPSNSVLTSYRVSQWVREWASRDPPALHWHIGPVAVDPAAQQQGVGSAMLSAVCSHMDAYGSVSYLETDRPESVRFYQKFGFLVLEESKVLGVSTWYMSRPCRRGIAQP
jgi:ribosomal protein S18 acetylase RimI-like enzyme